MFFFSGCKMIVFFFGGDEIMINWSMTFFFWWNGDLGCSKRWQKPSVLKGGGFCTRFCIQPWFFVDEAPASVGLWRWSTYGDFLFWSHVGSMLTDLLMFFWTPSRSSWKIKRFFRCRKHDLFSRIIAIFFKSVVNLMWICQLGLSIDREFVVWKWWCWFLGLRHAVKPIKYLIFMLRTMSNFSISAPKK